MAESPIVVKSSLRIVLIGLAVLVVVAGIAGYGIYNEQVRPFRTVVLEVDDVDVRMDYFLKRLAMSELEPLQVLDTLVREELILLLGPQPPYNVKVGEADIDALLRDTARGDSPGITDAEYREWFRQQLNETGLSSDEFRDVIRRTLTARELSVYLGERAETVLPHVRLQLIRTADLIRADDARRRLDAGEAFEAVAREFNDDPQLRRSGGEWGWFARPSLHEGLAPIVFDQLEVGAYQGPLELEANEFMIVRLVERVAAREVDPGALPAVRDAAINRWLLSEFGFHRIDFHGFSNGYDSETDAWVRWQLQRIRRQTLGAP